MKFLWAPWRIRFILDHMGSSRCVFCDLPKTGDDPKSLILGRSKHTFAILNKYPYNSGHLMIVPFQHTADLGALSPDELLDIHQCIRDSIRIVQGVMSPQGFNVGMNLGAAGGAGIRDHLHYHVVPRWTGDTNYMPVLADVKVLPESLDETFTRLSPHFARLWRN